MNGDHGTMDEPTNELDAQADPNELNSQFELKNSECLINGTSGPNRFQSENQDDKKPVKEKPSEETDESNSENLKICQNNPQLENQDDEKTNDDKTTEDTNKTSSENYKIGQTSPQPDNQNIEELVNDKTSEETDETNQENLRISQNKPQPDNQDDEETAHDKTAEDSNETNSDNNKSAINTYEPETLKNKNNDTDDTPDLFSGTPDFQADNDSMETLSDSNKHVENTELVDEDSSNSQDWKFKKDLKEHISTDEDALNSLESNHNSEDELSEYIHGAVDPIASSVSKEEEQNVHKLFSKETETGSFQIVSIKSCDSGEDSSDCSDSELEPKAEDAVSVRKVTSEGDSCEDNEKPKSIDIIILQNDQNKNRNGAQSPEIHEICSDNSDNDDCVVTGVQKIRTPKKRKSPKPTPTSELRRSSRTIKRRKYDDEIEELDENDESDLEEVFIEDPLRNKLRIASNLNRKISQKKDSIVIINSPIALKNRIPANKSNSPLHRNIYQKIAARGTSVTPISSKNVETKSMATQATPEPILPTLTDDMFVVEAPSFIVPYVYEKPAAVPFKEFVEKLGKEIEEEKAKAELELLEKKKAEKAKREQERQEKLERGEEVQESQDEESDEVKEKKKAEKAEKKERRRRQKEEDDASWDGSSSEESDDESLSDDDSQTKDICMEGIKDVAATTPNTDSYFDLRLGKFFMDIGSNLVQEYVQADLLHQHNRKLQREKKSGQSTKNRQLSIALLTKNLELSQKNNSSFTFQQKKCKFCSFKTESMLTMEHHLETPHLKNNMYICNFCSLELQSPHNMLYHMDKNHGVKGRLERVPVLHQCANCPFEDQGKGKFSRHVIACSKKFKPETNLAPPVDWEHPAKIPKLTRARAPAGQFARQPAEGVMRVTAGAALTSPTYRPRAPVPPGARPPGLFIRQTAPQQPTLAIGNVKKQSNHSIHISPSTRPASPIQPLNAANAKGVVMCEICDGYIKDLDQLRNHMQWIHKVKIHPKMIYNRPPLNCQKCQFRFFTDQGLERHLLGSHGLVTSAVQEAANKGKDAGRCPVCGRAYQRKLLAHVSRDHNLVLKPAHLSYKCTVCTATFGMYRQFENHVYSSHSVVAKKAIDKKKAAAGDANDKAVKQLKNNEDITITAQPAKIGAAKKK